MPIKYDIKVRTDELNRKVRELLRVVPLNVNDVIHNESRLLVEELVDRTKPRSLSKLKRSVNRTYLRVFRANPKGLNTIRGSELAQLYKAQQNRGYRVKPRILVKGAALRDAIRLAQSHCGFFAAGWLGKGNPLGAKRGVPGYVKRQVIQGRVAQKLGTDSIRVTGTNLVEFMNHFPKIRKAELRLLYAAMGTRIFKTRENLNRIMSGGAKYRIPK